MDNDQWRQIEDRFHQAAELAPDERSKFLDQACAGDEQMRRDVESLLAADAPEGEVLESAVNDVIERLPTAGNNDSELIDTRVSRPSLGPYQIIERIGAGGMAKVYKAHDTRLGRTVAIKISAERFSGRFQGEARAIASLNHPHICTIHDVGPDYLVMEYIDGKQLEGPLPTHEVLRLGLQIADAVSHAHRRGLVHRDLKPGNIMVTKSGAKVLDFGLAKPITRVQPDSSPAETVKRALTQEGTLVGTLNYMAPEQLEGRDADARTDIFAFGVVLYEMIAGRSAFRGNTEAALIASILASEPQSIATLQPLTPPALDHLIKTCLARDPDDRCQSMHDVMLQLKWLAEAGSHVRVGKLTGSQSGSAPAEIDSTPAPKTHGLRFRGVLPWAVAAVLGGVAVWSGLHVPAAPPRPVTRWSTQLTDTWSTMLAGAGPYPGVAVSRDGTRLVYGGGLSRSQTHLTLRMLHQIEGQALPGTGGAFQAAFSPDGQWVVFRAQNMLYKIPVTGGTASIICKVSSTYGLSWGIDDTIVFGRGISRGLMRVPAAGGEPETLTTPDSKNGEVMHVWPQFLPDGKSVVFTISMGQNYEKSRIAVLDLKSRAWHVVATGALAGRYVPSGHLVYAREGGDTKGIGLSGGVLFSVPFDAGRRAVTGVEAAVVEGVSWLPQVGFADYAVADSGLLVYVASGERQFTKTLEWADRKGVRQPFNAPVRDYAGLRLSPDGDRVALVINSADLEGSDIWIYELARDTLVRLTFGGLNSRPEWTPDGRRVAYYSTRAGMPGLYWITTDGNGKPELLLATASVANPNSWTPDGKALLYSQLNAARDADIWILPAPESGRETKPREFLRTAFNEQHAQISPDGKWVAYSSDESGQVYVYVAPFPGLGGKVQVSTQPRTGMWRWASNSRELFYRERGEQFWVVDVQAGVSFRAGRPQALFTHLGNFDILPDGKRFLLVKSESPSGGARLEAITDWFEDLRRRATPR